MPEKNKRGTLKAVLLLVFILAAVALFRLTPAADYRNPSFLRQWVGSFGSLAPLVFIGLCALGISLFLPAPLFTGIGALMKPAEEAA